MRQLRDMLAQTAKDLEAFRHPRVSIAWQDLDLVYRRVHNPSPDLGMDILGKKLQDIIGANAQARRLTAIKQQVLATGKPHQSVVAIKLGGNEHIVDLSIEVTRNEDGEIDGLVSVNIDVTDLVHAREQLSEANARLVKMLDNALDNPVSAPRRRTKP